MIKKVGKITERGVANFKGIFSRFRRRDFSGNTGQAVKNSTYQLSTNLVAKGGSLVFTAIIARILLPGLFGLYSLALGTIIFFSAFSDLGLDSAVITFVSRALGRGKEKKAKAYFIFLSKIKFWATIVVSFVLIGSAYFLANNFYQKPIFLALLAGGLYLCFATASRFIETTYTAVNNFKTPLVKEIIFQILRIVLVPLVLILLSSYSLSDEQVVLFLILILSLCYGLSSIYLVLRSKKGLSFLRAKSSKLTVREKSDVRKFSLPLTLTVLSGIFFGYIDTLMLGRYVSSEFIGYYGAAFSLVSSAMVIISFGIVAVYPIFTKMHGARLKKAFKKVYLFNFFMSLCVAVFAFFSAKYLLMIVYGSAFLPATIYLKLLSPVLLIGTIIGVYTGYFISMGRTKIVAGVLVFSTILNIVLNYIFITRGLRIGFSMAVIGACVATIISKIVFMVGLEVSRRRIR
jgi:stage V sporulation protein B